MTAAALVLDAPWVPDLTGAPSVLSDEVLLVVACYSDDLVVRWALTDPTADALAVLSDRERAHARGLHAIQGVHAAARYLREQLERGDHVQSHARLTLAKGARLKIDERHYSVEERRASGRTWILRGPQHGRVELHAPLHPRVSTWSAWHGRDRTAAKLRHYVRTADGHFHTAAR